MPPPHFPAPVSQRTLSDASFERNARKLASHLALAYLQATESLVAELAVRAAKVAQKAGCSVVLPSHLAACIQSDDTLDFLAHIEQAPPPQKKARKRQAPKKAAQPKAGKKPRKAAVGAAAAASAEAVDEGTRYALQGDAAAAGSVAGAGPAAGAAAAGAAAEKEVEGDDYDFD